MFPELDSSCETKLTLHQAWPMPGNALTHPGFPFRLDSGPGLSPAPELTPEEPQGRISPERPATAVQGCVSGPWMGHSDPTPVLPGSEWACRCPGQGAALDCRSVSGAALGHQPGPGRGGLCCDQRAG